MPGGSTWLSLLWVTVCVAAILVLAYWFTKYVAARGFPGIPGSREWDRFKVLARLALGREESLVLVQAGERYFLLGCTPTGISNLAEFSKEEAEAWLGSQEEKAAPPSFREAVRMVIEQRRQR